MARASPAVTTAAPRLSLYLLGPFCVAGEKGPIRLPTRKIESLPAYLVLHPEPHSREKLAALLWGDSPDTQARGSHRKALTLLRDHLSKDIVVANRESIQLNPEPSLGVDALEFEKIARSQSLGGALRSETENLQSAIALYRGDLLTDFYDDWILRARERFRALYLDTLLRLVQELRTRSEYDRALLQRSSQAARKFDNQFGVAMWLTRRCRFRRKCGSSVFTAACSHLEPMSWKNATSHKTAYWSSDVHTARRSRRFG